MPAALPAYFDAAWYLRAYPDVAASGANPARHYRLHGRAEGRLPCFLAAMARERDFKQGMLAQGAAGFAPLLDGPDPAERLWARVALARAAAARGDWAEAEHLLAPLDPARDLIKGFGLPDIALLAIESAVRAENHARAAQVLRLARRAFGRLPDLDLARANQIAARYGLGRRWQLRIAGLYARAGLGGFAVTPGQAPAFDRLRPVFPQPRPQGDGPLVSILMPARNAGATIATALASLCGQSWRNLEILVIDNGSGDDTAARVRLAAARDPRIRLLDGSAEPGAYPARNIGMAAAQGAFITVLDADDWAHPARTALQLRALLQRPQAAASVSHWVRTSPDMRFTRWWGDEGHLHRNASSLMIRAELRDSLGFWDRARVGADSEFHRRILALHGPGAVLELLPKIPLSLGRVSADSLTGALETSITSQHFGARRSYDQAADRWHRALTATPDPGDPAAPAGPQLPLPQHPARRPFAIPPALALGDPPPLPQPEDRILAAGLYQDRWYLQTYHDLRQRGVDGASHYLTQGAAEGRDPGPGFSSTGYALRHACDGQNPALHALATGQTQAGLPEWAGDLPPPAPGCHHLYVGHQARPQLFGAERSLLDMLARAGAAGITPSLLLPHLMNPDYLAALRPLCHRIHVLPYGWRFGAVPPPPETVARLVALIRRLGVSALHQNTAVLAAPLIAARAAGVPSTVHVRELPAEDPVLCHDLGLPHWEWRDQLLVEADRFVANSQAVVEWLATEADRVSLVPNRVDPALFDLAPPRFSLPLRVALIGSLTRRKGLGDMVALAQAAQGLPLRFVLIGPAHPDLDGLGRLPANLTHAGYAAGAVAAMAQADIVLCLSHFAESYGRSVAEAMAAARPVITYRRGTPPRLLTPDSRAGAAARNPGLPGPILPDTVLPGAITPPDDPMAVLAVLRKWVTNPACLPAMAAAARHRAKALQDGARAL